MDWFIYDNGLRHERVKIFLKFRNILSCIIQNKKLYPPVIYGKSHSNVGSFFRNSDKRDL